MTLQEALAKMNELEAAQQAYNHAMGVLSLDGETAAPRNAAKGRGQTFAYLSGVTYQLLVNDQVREVLETVLSATEGVTPVEKRRAELLKEDYDDMTRIPMEEFIAYSALSNEASAVWHDAKVNNDYPLFAPYLEKLIEYQRRFASYKDDKRHPYDVMLDNFEKGSSRETLDPFFATLRKNLTPVILEVSKKPQPRTDFLTAEFPLHLQREFSDKLMALMGIDRDCCGIAETEHPFTTNFNNQDVRITTHYHLNDLSSSMYSVIHEGGHALYELGTGDDIQFTCLASGASMGLHESQSRFYENLIGRSLPFCRALLPVIQEIFPAQMAGVTPEMLYATVNKSEPSLIRTEADELTYGNHVMIRYEMEKLMFSGDVKVAELPGLWNEMYRKYLGVEVPDDRRGILQDSHWSGGAFGYFPSYALGSAYGVQMLTAMEKDVPDLWQRIEKGDLSPATAWLKEKIHRFGRVLTPAQLLENSIGGPFDPTCYTDYLTRKFTDLYRL